MTREKIGRNKHKSPRFKESYDEDYGWEDQREKQERRKKLNKKSQRRTTPKEKW